MNRLPSLVAACGLALGVGAGVVGQASAADGSVPQPAAGLSRIAGAERYATSALVSQSQWGDAGGDGTGRAAADAAVRARGDMFPDALAGVPLAAKVKGPLLLTDPKSLTGETGDEIRRVLGAASGKAVYILGGTGAVSAGVEDALTRAGYVWPRPPFAMMPADLARYFEVRGSPG